MKINEILENEQILSFEEVKGVALSTSKWIAIGNDGKEYEATFIRNYYCPNGIMYFAIPSTVTILGYKAVEG